MPYPFPYTQMFIVARLLRQKTDSPFIITTILFYCSRANWTEIQVWSYEDSIVWEDKTDGQFKSGSFDGGCRIGFPLRMASRFSPCALCPRDISPSSSTYNAMPATDWPTERRTGLPEPVFPLRPIRLSGVPELPLLGQG